MELFGFLTISFIDILDILVVALIIFGVFRAIRGSTLMTLFGILLVLMVLRVVFGALDMRMTSRVFDAVFDIGIIGLIIIFQPEIRHFLMRVGNNAARARKGSFFNRLFGNRGETLGSEAVKEVTEAVRRMSADPAGVRRRL